jgi:2-methylcitrate dehydratase
MCPSGHARNTTADLKSILPHKAAKLGELGLPDGAMATDLVDRFQAMAKMTAKDVASLYNFEIADRPGYE